MAGCSDCPLAGRRQFIADAVRAISTAVLAVGVWTDNASGMRFRFDDGSSVGPHTIVYPIPQIDGATIDRSAHVILVRYEHSVYAFRRTCPHQNTALRWRRNDRRFQCPKHNSRYTPDGRFMTGRATRGMDRFEVSRDGGNVVVNTAAYFKQDEEPTN